MRRWLLIFLVFLLPLQYSWAMSAAYCAHEQDAQTQHWGHHEHPGNAAEDRSHAAKLDQLIGEGLKGEPRAGSAARLREIAARARR